MAQSRKRKSQQEESTPAVIDAEGPSDSPLEEEQIEKFISQVPPTELHRVMEVAIARISGPSYPPYASKITSEHIDKIIDLSGKQDEREYDSTLGGRILFFGIFFVLIGVFIWLTVYLAKADSVLYSEIITTGIKIAAGFGLGYGYKASRSK